MSKGKIFESDFGETPPSSAKEHYLKEESAGGLEETPAEVLIKKVRRPRKTKAERAVKHFSKRDMRQHRRHWR